jgi:hypothetical protein
LTVKLRVFKEAATRLVMRGGAGGQAGSIRSQSLIRRKHRNWLALGGAP